MAVGDNSNGNGSSSDYSGEEHVDMYALDKIREIEKYFKHQGKTINRELSEKLMKYWTKESNINRKIEQLNRQIERVEGELHELPETDAIQYQIGMLNAELQNIEDTLHDRYAESPQSVVLLELNKGDTKKKIETKRQELQALPGKKEALQTELDQCKKERLDKKLELIEMKKEYPISREESLISFEEEIAYDFATTESIPEAQPIEDWLKGIQLHSNAQAGDLGQRIAPQAPGDKSADQSSKIKL